MPNKHSKKTIKNNTKTSKNNNFYKAILYENKITDTK